MIELANRLDRTRFLAENAIRLLDAGRIDLLRLTLLEISDEADIGHLKPCDESALGGEPTDRSEAVTPLVPVRLHQADDAG